MKKLAPRLEVLARWLDADSCLVDIGCDHAWLPIYALRNGLVLRAIAVDRRPAPLALAKKHGANVPGLSFALSDGFRSLQLPPNSTVSIAGMGGLQICAILEQAPWSQIRSIVLQPNRDAHLVRQYLANQGWGTVQAMVYREQQRFFLSWKAQPISQKKPPGQWSWAEYWFEQHPQSEWYAWLNQRLGQLQNILAQNPSTMIGAVEEEKLAIQNILIRCS